MGRSKPQSTQWQIDCRYWQKTISGSWFMQRATRKTAILFSSKKNCTLQKYEVYARWKKSNWILSCTNIKNMKKNCNIRQLYILFFHFRQYMYFLTTQKLSSFQPLTWLFGYILWAFLSATLNIWFVWPSSADTTYLLRQNTC